MRRLAIVLAAVGSLVFAATGLTAASRDDLLKDEQHFFDRSQKTCRSASTTAAAARAVSTSSRSQAEGSRPDVRVCDRAGRKLPKPEPSNQFARLMELCPGAREPAG